MVDSFNNSENDDEESNHDLSSENNDNYKDNLNSFKSRLSSSSIQSKDSNSISNFSVSINSDTSHMTKSKKKVKILTKKKEKYFFCIKCKKFYIIDFESNIFIKIECDCKTIKNCIIDDFIKEYIIENLEEVEKNINCKIHNKKYKIYCIDCKEDLCEDCEKETKKYNNIEIIIKKHETHSVINLQDEIKAKIQELKPLLKNIRANIPKGLIDVRRILNLIIDLTKYHVNFYSYNLYKSLDNALKFVLKFEMPKELKMIKINSKTELNENMDSVNKIISIKINNQKLSDLSSFINLNTTFLIELDLNYNEIEDISPLKNCNFDNLEIFNLAENKLNNNNLKVLKNFKMPKVQWFNLYSNKFTTTEIIELAQNFPNLENFYVGNNKFDKEELDKNKIYNFPEKLRVFGITGNLTQETSNFILKLKIEKLKTLYISRNNLTSLSFLQYIKFENLEEIWPSFNNIEDWKEIENIQQREKIKKINLKGNKISNIDDILDIIKEFPNLKELILENNPINSVDEKIINQFKEKKIIFKFFN